LLMDRFSPRSYVRRFTVASVTSPGNVFAETPVADQDISQAAWSSDGSHIYAFAPSRLRSALDLVDIAWPLRTGKAVLSGELGHLSMAEEAGDVVVLAASGDGEVIVWRKRAGAAAEQTAIALPSYPMQAVVSPSGKQLAVVYGKEGIGDGGLKLYAIDDGTERQIPNTTGKNIQMLHWALNGRALVFTVVPKGVSPYEEKATGKQVWLVQAG